MWAEFSAGVYLLSSAAISWGGLINNLIMSQSQREQSEENKTWAAVRSQTCTPSVSQLPISGDPRARRARLLLYLNKNNILSLAALLKWSHDQSRQSGVLTERREQSVKEISLFYYQYKAPVFLVQRKHWVVNWKKINLRINLFS